MTPTRLAECLTILGWTAREFARRLNLDDRAIRRWLAGSYQVPGAVAGWLEEMVEITEKNPPPSRTETQKTVDIAPSRGA